MVLQSGTLRLYVTFLAAILKTSFGQNECPKIVYVEDIEEEGQPDGMLTFDGLTCNVTIKELDNFNNLNLVLVIIAAAGFLLWISTTCIICCICCYKRNDTRVGSGQDLEQQLVNGRPHCAPPDIQAPRPGETVEEDQDVPYAKAAPLQDNDIAAPLQENTTVAPLQENPPAAPLQERDTAAPLQEKATVAPPQEEKQHHQCTINPIDQVLASRTDHIETASDVDSPKSQESPGYLVPNVFIKKQAPPLFTKPANPYRSKSFIENSSSQSGRDRSPLDFKPSRRSDPNFNKDGPLDLSSLNTKPSARSANFDTDGPLGGIKEKLEMVLSSNGRKVSMDMTPDYVVNSNLNGNTSRDGEDEVAKAISDESPYDSVDILSDKI